MACLWPDRHWAFAASTDMVRATSELYGWLTDQRTYEGQHKQGWLSALADFKFSATQLGPQLRATLSHDLVAAIAVADSLTADFANFNAGDLAATVMPARLAGDQAVFVQLSGRMAEPDVREASWIDLADACRDEATSYETLALRRDLFWELIRAGDYGPEEMSRLLAAVLTDSEFLITEARLWLGDIAEADVAWPLSGRDAGLTEDQQLALCRRLMTKPPAPGNHVVWVAFDRAGPGHAHLKVGSVTFWNCEWVRAILEQGGPNLEHIPAELKAADGLFHINVLPSDRDVMLARVELGMGAFTDPVRRAGEQAEAVVALAGFHVGDAKWRRLPGHLSVVDGRVRSTGTFSHDLSADEIPNGLYQDAMEAELIKLAPRLAGHLPITDTGLSEVIQAVRWWQQARRQPPLATVLLHVRVLELIAQRANAKPWYQYLETYHRAAWIRQTMISAVGSVIDDCLRSAHRVAATADQTWLREFSLAITTWKQGSPPSLDLKQGIEALPELIRIFPVHDRPGRRVRSIASHLSSTDALLTWGGDLANEWSLVLKRLQRIRNALAHGGPIEDRTVPTVHLFALQLAGWSLSVALEGVLDGTGVVPAHEEYRQEAHQWASALASASNAVEALLGQE